MKSPPEPTREPADIVFAVVSLGTGGMERRCLLLATALVERGWNVAIITMKAWSEDIAAVDPRIRVFRVTVSQAGGLGWLEFFRLVQTLRPTVYQGFGTLAGFPGTVAARVARVPVVINAFAIGASYYPRWFGPFGRASFLFASHAVANSRGVSEEYVRAWRLPPRKITTIPNPVEISAWPYRDPALRASARQELGLRQNQPVVGCVARFYTQKGHKYLLEAFARIVGDNPDVVLALVGDGPLMGELRADAERLGLGDHVRFVGLRHDVPRLLQAFDLFCLPSLFEGMPNVVLEAMATGLAVVSTAVAGAAELVVPGKTGWIVPVAEVEPLAEALREALSDPGRLRAYGEAGRRHVEEEFDLPVIVGRYLSLYEEITKLGPQRRTA